MDPAQQIEHFRLGAHLAELEIPEFVLPARHHVVLHDMRFHYLDWGTRGERPVVFLHGGGQTARTWDLPCLALRPDHHCFALDQRGHGDSEWSYGFDYGPEAHVRDLEAFVSHLGLERFALVGMSMGCVNALFYALQHPERLTALVAVDAGPTVRLEGGERIRDFRRHTAELDSIDEFVERALRFNPRRDPRLLRMSLLHNLRRLPSGRWTWKTDHRGDSLVPEIALRLEELRDRVAEIHCPTLVLRGAESDVFLDEHAEDFAGALPDGRWRRVAGAGHTVQGDNPRAFVGAVREFLDEVEGRERH